MNWFYALNGQQAGPVEDAELDRLVQTDTIKSDTLVWHSGLPNWLPYAQARAGSAAATVAPDYGVSGYSPAAVTAGPSLAKASYTPGQVVCSECQQSFPPDEVVQVEGLNVCSNCKPILLQKLREGVRPTGAGLNYAGFWVRFGAVFIDGIIVQVASAFIGFIVGLAMSSASPDARTSITLGLQGVILLLAASYEIIFISKYGATPGKMACGLQVVRPDGTFISIPRSIGRYFSKFLSGIILLIGYIMAAFDAEKRALHDQICDTRVVVKTKGT